MTTGEQPTTKSGRQADNQKLQSEIFRKLAQNANGGESSFGAEVKPMLSAPGSLIETPPAAGWQSSQKGSFVSV